MRAGNLGRGAAAGSLAALAARIAGLVVVPIALHGLGAQLYGVWVVAGVIVTSQGLFDLGATQMTARYIAVGRVVGDRDNIRRVIVLSSIVYAVLSAVAVAVILPLGGPISDVLGVSSANRPGAEILLWAGALAFGLSNASGLLTGVLTGLDRAHTAYAALAGGFVVYVCVIVLGAVANHVLWGMAVSGPALFAAQFALMLPHAFVGLKRIPRGTRGLPVRLRELLSYSVGIQSASIADFAALNFPRFLAAIMLGAGAVVPLDVALRCGSLIAGLLAMTQPGVLPALATAWGRGNLDEYRQLARDLFAAVTFGAGVLMLLSIACLGPAVRLWLGSKYGRSEGLVLVITAALLVHGVTAPLTAAAQARGQLRRVVLLKIGILAAIAVLIPPLSTAGVTGLGCALAAGLALPSMLYCWGELRRPLRRSAGVASAVTDIGPFLAAAILPLGLRVAILPSDGAAIALSAATFAAASLWTVRRPPTSIRWMFAVHSRTR